MAPVGLTALRSPRSLPHVSETRPRLFLIDASGHIFRAFHAIPELSTSKGLPTNAVLGFTNMLRKLLREEEPAWIAACFDPPGPTIRHEAYEEYKQSRPEVPENLKVQIPYVRRVCAALQVPILEIEGYEADDVIGTLAKMAMGRDIEVVIVSEDKDLLQLVDDGVTMLSERGERRVYDREAVEERYGVPPEAVPDLLALVGDSVDDIPGVKGIGKKGAATILAEYGTLEEAIEHADEITRMKYGEKLAAEQDKARLSKELATVHTDLPVELDLDELQAREPRPELARELFAELEFRSLLEEFVEAGDAEADYRLLDSAAALEQAIGAARDTGRVAFRLALDHPQPMRARIVGVGMAWEEGGGAYLPVGHRTLGAANTMSVDEALETLRPLLTGGEAEIVGQDLKRDLVVLKRHGIDDVCIAFDTMLASYLAHPTRSSHDLRSLALDFLGTKPVELGDILPSRDATFADVPLDVAIDFAAEDADLALRLTRVLEAELEAQDQRRLHDDMELPLTAVLADLEHRGVGLDVDYLHEMGEELGSQIADLEEEIWELAGSKFNINSPKQLAGVLFDDLELPVGGRTAKTGSRSTRAEVLENLASEHPIARRVLDWRELSKLMSTYVEALPEMVDPETGRVHTSFNQTVAATGRLSSSNPNLQNIPVRTPLGRKIRRAFVPAGEHVLMAADYSQIELRIMAHLSGDPRLRTAFQEGVDIHRATAAEIFGVDPEEVAPEQRDRAKVINFGIMYGMGPQRLAREFDIPLDEAREFIDDYFSIYSDVKGFLDSTIERARHDGYVTTMMGRIRHLPELHASRRHIQAAGERIAVNTPIQGTAADMIKVAMVRLHRRLRHEELGSRMLIQVHDELVLEVPEEEIDPVQPVIRQEMEQALELDVPLVVDIGWADNWMDAKA